VGAGYKSLADSIKSFQDLGEIPLKFDLNKIDQDGSGIANSLTKNNALWHKSCRNRFNATELKRLKKRKACEDERLPEENSPCKTRRTSFLHSSVKSNELRCFFCDEVDSIANLHCASTDVIDKKVKQCAVQLQDRNLLAKLAAAGDMVALEAKYHSRCLAALYNRCRQNAYANNDTGSLRERRLHGIAFAEIISYIEEFFEERNASGVPTLKLADLAKMYMAKLEELGTNASRVNTTRLKERILSTLPHVSAHPQGRDILLILDQDLGDAIKLANEQDTDADAMHLARAAKIVRKEILKQDQSFKGTFDTDCQENSIPQSLKALINFILRGPTSQRNTATEESVEVNENQASRSISQLIIYNTTIRQTKTASIVARHSRERETPLPIYVALKIHGLTRGRSLIDALFNLGLCISYDRVLSISTDIANSVCERFQNDGVVCPPILKSGLFTTAGFDNIDHNPSSTTARDSFHGTAMSLIQHPTKQSPGTVREVTVIDGNPQKERKVSSLPSQFTDVQPVVLIEQDLFPPPLVGQLPAVDDEKDFGYKKEVQWLDNVKELIRKEKLDSDDSFSWAAYHASSEPQLDYEPAVTSLMPLFLENAHSAPMILHGMNVICSAVELVNPGQTPVIAMDQPLFALAKQIQWRWPHTHGEDKLLIMFGGLHIELAMLRTLGKWLDKSGWTTVLVNAGVATPGVADSFTSAKHITRTRRAHQITSASLYILQLRAYGKYITEAEDRVPLSFTDWRDKMSKMCPHFLYWCRVMELQLLCLQLVKAFRTADFKLYVDSLTKMMPWMFALDQTNYCRWLPVHIRDMQELPIKHPDVYEKFTSGFFVVHKTRKRFSAMALDQAHEQENAVVKGEGGAVGLTENPGALKRWMISGPEIARIVKEFETATATSSDDCQKHHEQSYDHQVAFMKDVQSVIDSFEELGNPYMEKGKDLLAVDTKDIMNNDVVEAVKNVDKIGQEQYSSYVECRLKRRTTSISEPNKKNQLPLFSNSVQKVQSKDKSKIVQLKNDCSLFSRLYIACQSRDGNLEEFFRHENQPWPPSLADRGEIRKGQKADLVKCFETLQSNTANTTPVAESVIIDGAVAVQMLNPGTARTFQEYSDTVFKPYITKQLEHAKRVDIIWDVYKDDSLKSGTREKRGKGTRRRVLPSTTIPRDWHLFLRVDENKVELFHLLSEQIALIRVENKEIYTTVEENVLYSGSRRDDLSSLEPCSHEEADTRIMLHVQDAAVCGHQRIMIRTIDTDVVALAISIFHIVPVIELWIAFGTGKHFRYLAVHDIAKTLGHEKCKALPLFHAMTGCDTGNISVLAVY
jgi:hypothetical protein